jgi:ATP/maltotriose-dependent transcriptional regulator MalT
VHRRGYQFVGTVEQTAEGLVTERDLPLPERLAMPTGLGFAGREHELAVLEHLWKQMVASQQRRLALISGEAGIGKTTLCSVFAASAHQDAVVLYGRCDEELSIPYQPWR